MDVTYELLIGGEGIDITAEDARAFWEDTPATLRRGRRDGAFILWGEDEFGRLVAPIVFRPKRSSRV